MLYKIKHYLKLMRWHRPLPILLSLWPTYWGLFLGQKPSLKLWIVFSLGVILMRAAGCVMNDLFDQNYDRFIARTADRPLASGDVNKIEAILLTGLLLFLAFLLLFFLNPLAQYLSIPALILAVVYPLAKRFTYFPQIVLGLAFNFGMIMSYAAVNNSINHFILYLYALAVLWTVFYDTIYSLMDYTDDKRFKIKSPATYLDGKVYPFLFILALLLWIGGILVLHYLHLQSAVLFGIALSFCVLRTSWKLLKSKLLFLLPILFLNRQMPGDKPPLWSNPILYPSWGEAPLYQKLFNEQQWFGFLIFLMIASRFLGF